MEPFKEDWKRCYPEWFSLLLEDVDGNSILKLRNEDEEYRTLMSRKNRLLEEYPCIDKLIEGESAISITAEEHQKFLEYLILRSEMEYRERVMFYWYGHLHCYEYMSKMEDSGNENE